jgi:electron transport complex protein RnfE
VKARDFPRSLWGENPLAAYLVGLCPALAVSNRLANALLLGAVMLFALLGTGIASVALERLLPSRLRLAAALRLSARLLVASALVTAAQRFLWVLAPAFEAGLGIYLPLLAVNCLLLSSSGAGSWSQGALEAAGRAAAFAAVLVCLALVREVLGTGTITLFPVGRFRGVLSVGGLPPARVLAAAPGALLLLGYASALVRRGRRRRQ